MRFLLRRNDNVVNRYFSIFKDKFHKIIINLYSFFTPFAFFMDTSGTLTSALESRFYNETALSVFFWKGCATVTAVIGSCINDYLKLINQIIP